MHPGSLEQVTKALLEIATQLQNSAHLLNTDDPDLLADVGAKEGARIRSAIEEFDKLLPELAEVFGYALDEHMGPTLAAAKLTKAAQQVARHDASNLQKMGRGFMHREEERLRKAQGILPHLERALRSLEGSDD